MEEFLDFDSTRRFGVEIEINAFDGKSRPDSEVLPKGIQYFGHIVSECLKERVVVNKWTHNHNNDEWIVKPDSSCGIEICSAVLKGMSGINKVGKVVEMLRADSLVSADYRCSFHVHVEVSDLSLNQLGSILSWWLKCEPVFYDAVPFRRKRNRYCQIWGLSDMFEHDVKLNSEYLIKCFGSNKYTSLNTFHYCKKKRETIEFRIMEEDCCINSESAKNWIILLVHFVETAIKRGLPDNYRKGDKWSSYLWLDPMDVFEFLGYNLNLGPILSENKKWFLNRLNKNIGETLGGFFIPHFRSIATKQIGELINKNDG